MIILGNNYKVIDTFDVDMTVPDCLVVNKNKLGTGHGEAKLYVASKDTMHAFYGDEGFTANCFLLKEDLRQYMMSIQTEYFKPTYDYRGKDEMKALWESRMAYIESLDDIIYFDVKDQAQIVGGRGYVNSSDLGYQIIREIALPLVSYISVMKLTANGTKTYFYWKLFVDYDKLNADDALVFNYGKSKDEPQPVKKPSQKETDYNRARVGQGKYRDLLLEECMYCPITMINDERLLIASHIKPWAVSNEREKVDPKNGFILSPLYDRLFDKGLITFTDDKRMLVSNWLSPNNIKRMNLEDGKLYSRLPIDEQRLVYLEYHRACVFKG